MELRPQQFMAGYFRDLAAWRRQRAEEYDRDPRNLQSATGLDDLAVYIESLPDDDPRVARLRDLAMSASGFEPGQQAHFHAARFRFYYDDTTFDAFLLRMVELQERDAAEMGHFGGVLPVGDDPWAGRSAPVPSPPGEEEA